MEITQYQTRTLTSKDLLLFDETICKNPYIPYKPYPRQSWPIFEVNRPLRDNTPNTILVGAGGYGGKTYLGSMLAAQYLTEEDYSCLVTRLNYAELTGQDSIWQNLTEWVCDENRLGDLACESNESKLKITSPSGAKIWFKAFDHPKKKQKVKSESYDRIINDEASELLTEILTFLYRSLRNSTESKIPLGMVYLSNPGGPSTEYLCSKCVDGPVPYFPLDWRHNPYINKDVYSKTLDNLSYTDQRYQKYGDWHYIPQAGDIFNQQLFDEATITLDEYRLFRRRAHLLQVVRLWDIAASDKETSDYTAHSLVYRYDMGDVCVGQGSFRLKPGPLEERMETVMAVDGPEVEQWIERQPAAAGKIVESHWTTRFTGYNVVFVPVFKNKVVRAGKLIPKMKDRKLLFVEDPHNPYMDVLIKQGINFPNFNKVGLDDPESVHDDRIDTLSLLYVKEAGNPYTDSSKRYDYTDFAKADVVSGRPWRTRRK